MAVDSRAERAMLLGVPRVHVALAFGAYACVVAVALLLHDVQARAVFVSLAYVAFLSGALLFNLRRALVPQSGRTGWLLVSVSALVALLFELWLAAEASFPARVLVPPGAWLIQATASNITISLGILLMPFGARTVRHRLPMAVDAFAFSLSAFLVIWVLGARQEFAESTAPLVTRLEAVSTYAFNALDLGIVVYIGSRSLQRLRSPLGWFLLAFLVLTAGTAVVMFGRVGGEPTVGGAGELLQLLAFPCFLLAPISRLPSGLEWEDDRSLGGDLLTYGPVLAAMVVALPARYMAGGGDRVLAIGLPVLACALLFRQFLAVRDVRALSRSLEHRVVERTEALRRSERALVQAQRLEAVGRVAGSVAHDFNNVLHAITLAAESLEESMPSADALDDLETIRTATRSGAALAREVLEFSKPQVETSEHADIAESLRALDWMRHELTQRRIRYETHVPADGLQVRLGATRLEQVLSNLISNARDAVADGGMVCVTAERTEIRDDLAASHLGLVAGTYVRLTVLDDGTGIPESVLPRVFEPYFTTKAEQRGTGLGLATTYNVVRRAGGTVTVSNQHGAGARFDVLLPIGG